MSAVERLRNLRAEKARELKELDETIRELEGADDAPVIVALPEFLTEEVDVEWIVGGQIARGGFGFISADPGLGKSTFVVQTALQLAAGLPVLRFACVGGRKRVLYLAAEGARGAIRARVKKAKESLNIREDLGGWFIQHADVREMKLGSGKFRSMLEQSKPDLVILDTLKSFWDGDENSADSFSALVSTPLKEYSAEYGCTFMCVHHHRKGGADDDAGAHKGRGTGLMFADSDFWWRMEKEKGTEFGRVLHCDKNKYGAAFEQTMLQFSGANATLEEVG